MATMIPMVTRTVISNGARSTLPLAVDIGPNTLDENRLGQSEKTVAPTGPVEGQLPKAAKGNPAAGRNA